MTPSSCHGFSLLCPSPTKTLVSEGIGLSSSHQPSRYRHVALDFGLGRDWSRFQSPAESVSASSSGFQSRTRTNLHAYIRAHYCVQSASPLASGQSSGGLAPVSYEDATNSAWMALSLTHGLHVSRSVGDPGDSRSQFLTKRISSDFWRQSRDLLLCPSSKRTLVSEFNKPSHAPIISLDY
jgi:hypothetical protein